MWSVLLDALGGSAALHAHTPAPPRQHTSSGALNLYPDNPDWPLARSANRGSQQARSSSPGPSPTPTADQLARDVARLARVREAGRARLRQLEDEGAVLREATRQVRPGGEE